MHKNSLLHLFLWDRVVMSLTVTFPFCYLPFICWSILHLTSIFPGLEKCGFGSADTLKSKSCQWPLFSLWTTWVLRSKWIHLHIFAYIYIAGSLLIHLVDFSIFLNLWIEIWIFCPFCEATKAGNGHFPPYSLFFTEKNKHIEIL